jgi:hypothetical protein
MKTWIVLLGLMIFVSKGLAEQKFSRPNITSEKPKLAETSSSKRPIAIKPFAPQESGAFVDLYKRGFIRVSPFAPAQEGLGEQLLVANPLPRGTATENSQTTAREFGGIKLLGINF